MRLLPGLFLAFPWMLAAADPAPLRFPEDGGLVNVQDYGAVPDDEGDDTAAIQAALDAFPSGNRIVFLPPGVYLLSDTLRWPTGDGVTNHHRRTILQGAGEGHSILRLPEATEGFEDPAKPRALIWTGGAPAQRFRNAVRDLRIEIGPRNPGAIGLQFNTSGQGGLRRVSIHAAEGSGRIGLDLGYCDEIGPLLAQRLTIEGFEFGLVTKWPVNSATFDGIWLSGQRRLGWWNYHQMIFVRGLVSENRVPALYNEKDSWGSVVMVDSHLHGVRAERGTPAIHNQRHLYLRNVDLLGYARALDNDDKGRDQGDIEEPGTVAEHSSHRLVRSLFRDLPEADLAAAGEVKHLPVKESPEVPWGDPEEDWVNLLAFGADPTGVEDASGALQKAIDSGARTIYLPGGSRFRFAGTVEIRGPVQRIIGLEGRVSAADNPVWVLTDGRHPQNLPDAPAVVIERLEGSGAPPLKIRHESQRTLCISSTSGCDVEGAGSGDLFIDDLRGHLDSLAAGQSAWCRQLNSGREGVKCRNRGGQLWILGLRAENPGTLVETSQGGTTEIVGAFLDSNGGWRPGEAAFVVDEAHLNLFGMSERNFNRQPISLWVRERQGGETRELRERPWIYLGQ